MKKKITELELLRGGGILLVVFVHIIFHNKVTLLQHFAIFFAMPLFFSISGFLYGYKDISKLTSWQNIWLYIKKKLIALGIPYVLFSIIYIVLNFLMNRYVDTNNVFELRDVLFVLYFPVAQYWYLWVLLIFFIISSCILRVRNIIAVFIFSMMTNIIWYFFYSDTELSVYSKILVWYMYFVGAACLGQLYKSNNFFTLLQKKENQFLLFILEIVFVVTGFYRMLKLDASGLMTSILQLVNTICGIIGFLFVMYNICRIYMIKKIVLIIAEYSWYIFIIHSFFTSLIKTILIKVYPNIDIYKYFICSLIITIVGCIIVGHFSKKIAIIDFMFYPHKYFKGLNDNRLFTSKK